MSGKEASESTVYTRTLRLAAETMGGADRLKDSAPASNKAEEKKKNEG